MDLLNRSELLSRERNPPTSQSRGAAVEELEIELPAAPHPLSAYVEAVQSNNLLFLRGMLPIKDGKLRALGRIGKELDESAGRDALRTATLNAFLLPRSR